MTGCRRPGRPAGLPLALKLHPSVILLELLLPGRDGWDLLPALRARTLTSQIPVIVCSVLYEPGVARALGATGYLSETEVPFQGTRSITLFRRRSEAHELERCIEREIRPLDKIDGLALECSYPL